MSHSFVAVAFKAAENARIADAEDTKTVLKDLVVTHLIRLGMALNFFVIQHEIFESPDESCGMAHVSFEDAIVEPDDVAEDSCEDSTVIMDVVMKFGPGAVDDPCVVKGLITDLIHRVQSEATVMKTGAGAGENPFSRVKDQVTDLITWLQVESLSEAEARQPHSSSKHNEAGSTGQGERGEGERGEWE